jgi:hypothetical protein
MLTHVAVADVVDVAVANVVVAVTMMDCKMQEKGGS